jgi:hypothetical protein
MSNKKLYLVAMIVAGVILFGLITNAFLLKPGTELLPTYALAELYVSVLAFAAVWITLIILIFQLRKSMAKPSIKVAFNERGEQQATLTYSKEGRLETGLPLIFLINEGNAVARYFQIDFVIPKTIARPDFAHAPFIKDNGNYILSYTNEGKYTLFVNRPSRDHDIIFSPVMKLRLFSLARFKIKYKVYGDWAETQEGELTIKCSKRRK